MTDEQRLVVLTSVRRLLDTTPLQVLSDGTIAYKQEMDFLHIHPEMASEANISCWVGVTGNPVFGNKEHVGRAKAWLDSEIAKLEQPPSTTYGGAVPYKTLLKHLEGGIGFDSEDGFFNIIGTDKNDSITLFNDKANEVNANSNVSLDLIDQENLVINYQTKDRVVAEQRKYRLVEWLKRRIDAIEQPPTPVGGRLADLQDLREILRGQPTFALNIGDRHYKHDTRLIPLLEEMEKATKCSCWISPLGQTVFTSPKDVNKALAWILIEFVKMGQPTDLQPCAANPNEEIKTLNKVIASQAKALMAAEESRDEYKRLYQEALAAAERQRLDLEAKLKPAVPPVEMPISGSVIEVLQEDGTWQPGVVFMDEIMGTSVPVGDSSTYNWPVGETNHGTRWRWPQAEEETK